MIDRLQYTWMALQAAMIFLSYFALKCLKKHEWFMYGSMLRKYLVDKTIIIP
jgi:hypothetical protein